MTRTAGRQGIEDMTDVRILGQISAGDVADLAKSGIKSIVCNRPDGEEDGQPTFAAIAKAAEDLGLAIRLVAVDAELGVTQENVEDMRRAIHELPHPLLAYCRSGARCRTLLAKC